MCKVMLYGNHDLRIFGTDDGIWRRIRRLESNYKFPQGNGVRDALATLEGPGILAWLIQGAADWYKYGLPTPERVAEATQADREAQDVVSGFFDQHLLFEPDGFVSNKDLGLRYAQWAAGQHDKMPSERDMVESLLARPGASQTRRGPKDGQRIRGVGGVSLKPGSGWSVSTVSPGHGG